MKRENQLVNGGAFLFCFGLLAFLPSITDRELLILSWLGAWQVPIGISSMVVGAALWVAGRIQTARSASPVEPPTGVPPAAPGAPGSAASGEPNTIAAAPNTIAGRAPQPNVLSSQASSEPADRR